jgi:uncharacterized membrane protein YhdT
MTDRNASLGRRTAGLLWVAMTATVALVVGVGTDGWIALGVICASSVSLALSALALERRGHFLSPGAKRALGLLIVLSAVSAVIAFVALASGGLSTWIGLACATTPVLVGVIALGALVNGSTASTSPS